MPVRLLGAMTGDTGRKGRKASSMSFSVDDVNPVQVAIEHRRGCTHRVINAVWYIQLQASQHRYHVSEGAPALAPLECLGCGLFANLEIVSLPGLCIRPGHAALLQGSQQPVIR
jgi:hypothetical protein